MNYFEGLVKRVREDKTFNPNKVRTEAEIIAEAKKRDAEDDDAEIIFVTDRSTADVVLPFDLVTFCIGRVDLLGFILHLYYAEQTRLATGNKIVNLSRFMGITPNTFKMKRQELIDAGALEIVKNGKRSYTRINKISRLPTFELPTDFEAALAYIEQAKKQLYFFNKKVLQDMERMQREQERKEVVDTRVKELLKKEQEKKKRQEQREAIKFPAENYTMVINGYKKYKQVGLVGPEVLRAKRAIKQMFLAQRTPKQILDCMKFFAEHKKDKGFEWLRSWTLETVMKKIPEFLAGQLKSERMEDQYERIS